MTTTLTPDICVIGAGSGGLSMAAIAAAFGVSVVLIERGKMGGDCLNYGCVPSKALLAAGHRAHDARGSQAFGITADPVIDFEKVKAHVAEVIGEIAPNDSVERFTGLGVHVLQAEGRFEDKNTVRAGDTLIKARKFVIATGSSARIFPIPGLETVPYLTNETIFSVAKQPSHLVVLGGGPIGLEMAQAFRRLGSQVTVLEADKALGKDDADAAAIVLNHLREEGVVIHERTKAVRVEKRGASGVTVVGEGPEGEVTIEGSHLLVALGRKPATASLNLEAAGIKVERDAVVVDSALRTSNKKVYAIGDATGGYQFTHVANYHAGLVAQQALFGLPAKTNTDLIPWVTYTDPELAHVGISEAEAISRHGPSKVKILRWSLAENDRYQAERQTSGFVKVVVGPKGRILGCTIVGSQAGELINMWSLALSQKMKIGAMRGFISPYPTRAEVSKRAAITYYADFPKSKLAQRMIKLRRMFG